MKLPIYLDHHATTPCDPRVLRAMLPYFSEEFGNPASRTHALGWRAEAAVEQARERVALLVGASPREIVFTSGATESNNLALFGVARAARQRGDHVVTLRTEHPSVLDPCRALLREGFRVSELGVDRQGLLDPDALRRALEPRTVLVSVALANGEIGVLQPLEEVARVCAEQGIALHTDAAQAVGKLPVDVSQLGVDLLSLTAHKLYGPKGIGALYVRRRVPRLALEPIQYGGGHERGLRSGTLPTPLCVGLGAACEIAASELAGEASRLLALRERLLEALAREIDGFHLNGHPEKRLPGNLNLSFDGVEGEALLARLPDLALSLGSACSSTSKQPSHVLRELGLDSARAASGVRIGLGRGTAQAEVDFAASRLAEEVRRLRGLAPRREGRARA